MRNCKGDDPAGAGLGVGLQDLTLSSFTQCTFSKAMCYDGTWNFPLGCQYHLTDFFVVNLI